MPPQTPNVWRSRWYPHAGGDFKLLLNVLCSLVGYYWIIALVTRETQEHACGTAVSGAWANRLMYSWPIRQLGDISLSYYLFHSSTYVAMTRFLPLCSGHDGCAGSPIGVACTWIAGIAVGWVATQYFEKPVAKLVLAVLLPAKATPPISKAVAPTTLL